MRHTEFVMQYDRNNSHINARCVALRINLNDIRCNQHQMKRDNVVNDMSTTRSRQQERTAPTTTTTVPFYIRCTYICVWYVYERPTEAAHIGSRDLILIAVVNLLILLEYCVDDVPVAANRSRL